MSKFLSPLEVTRDISLDNTWILTKPLMYANDEFIITVFKGFDFDFASVPNTPLLSWLFPKDGQETDRAACLHDALYASCLLPKHTCDSLFYEAMLSDGVHKMKAWAMYQAVKYAGHSAYNGDRDLPKYRNLVLIEVNDA